ncbi:uncharacterized protein LOC128963183 [Oppia nitens]|uniref:uncharacterized protein LOC128963183 n=1 Tax=Oppia nitens TaxID=1686743 RepID=UPI0023D9C4B9|nr:uncharacterized protein LOC128963183 [Oppia nitens]XP_054165665.1 uncharacterized protein LOC128963183 [Oppia nitens]XP_054165673.1 uncharacterized protein LOC128963183 [Oppia nitens]
MKLIPVRTVIIAVMAMMAIGIVRAQYSQQYTKIEGDNIISATYNLYDTVIKRDCIQRTGGIGGRVFPIGQSVETFISMVDTLEQLLENTTDQNLQQHIGADNVAKLLLRRFRFDGFDPNLHPGYKRTRDQWMDEIANAFLQPTGVQEFNNYYFPDQFFRTEELCSLYYMLSHNVYNIREKPRIEYSQVFRGKRQAYTSNRLSNGRIQTPNAYQSQHQNQNQGQTSNYGQYYQRAPGDSGSSGNNRMPVASNYLTNNNNNNNNNNHPSNNYQSYNSNNGSSNRVYYPLKEEGVVSFRSNPNEAISMGRVLIGVIAGMSPDIRLNTKSVIQAMVRDKFVDQAYVKDMRREVAIAAVTVGDLWGSAAQQDDEPTESLQYAFGIDGTWASQTCTTHYGLSRVPLTTPNDQLQKIIDSIRATKAEIRGGIDGYLIGSNLASLSQLDPRQLKLSTILRSFYGKPQISKSNMLTVSYCDRQRVNTQEQSIIQEAAGNYQIIQNIKFGGRLPPPGPLGAFSQALQQAAGTETSGTDFCNRPGGQIDKSAPCETPSDVIYIIDGSDGNKLRQSAEIVAQINANLGNIRPYGGSINIFLNSKGGRNDVNSGVMLPQGDWPLTPVAFNMSAAGCSQCRIDDFNTSTRAAVANIGQYFKALNTTLFNYEWWTPRVNDSAIPAKSAVLIDFTVGVVPDSGADYDDYKYFKDQLRYRHRDVRFLSIASNQDAFKDILRYEDDKEQPGNPVQIGQNVARKICENPAIFQYNMCEDKRSDGVQYVGFITPGYRQNWAMYPEFFHRSFTIRFSFKPEDGDIRICYDRQFPPEDQEYCKELTAGEEQYFEIDNPCKGKSVSSCRPFYFTVWAKDKTSLTQCLDPRCMNTNQIKFTVTHTGVQCSSSLHMLPSTPIQCISLITVFILYLFFNKH